MVNMNKEDRERLSRIIDELNELGDSIRARRENAPENLYESERSVQDVLAPSIVAASPH